MTSSDFKNQNFESLTIQSLEDHIDMLRHLKKSYAKEIIQMELRICFTCWTLVGTETFQDHNDHNVTDLLSEMKPADVESFTQLSKLYNQ